MLREPGSVVRVILIQDDGGWLAPGLASLAAPAFSRQARRREDGKGRLKATRTQEYGAQPFCTTLGMF